MNQTVLDIITSVMDHDPAHGLETIHKALDAGADPRSLARQIVEYLRGLMLIQMGNANQVEATSDVKKQMQAHAKSFSTSDVLRMMKAFNNAAVDLRGGWQPSLSLELALAEVLDAPNQPTPPPTAPPSSSVTIRAKPQPSSGLAPNVPQSQGPENVDSAHTVPVPFREDKPAPIKPAESPRKPAQSDEAPPKGANAASKDEVPTPRPVGKAALNAGEVIKVWK